MTNESPNTYQIGGTHYAEAAYQVWDYCATNAIPFLEGSAIKYIARSRKKHKTPHEDLEKAVHFVTKIRALYLGHYYVPRGFFMIVPDQEKTIRDAQKLCKENQLDELETNAIILLSAWQGVRDLEQVLELLRVMQMRPTKGAL